MQYLVRVSVCSACVCVCPTEHAPVMFCFCQSDSRDGIRSIYLESGITGHCLTVQADVLCSPSKERMKMRGMGRGDTEATEGCLSKESTDCDLSW